MRSKLLVPGIVVVALVWAACGSPTPIEREIAPGSGGSWQQLSEGPLEARRSSHAAWVGGRLYVMGGTEAPPCPPTADCIEAKEASFRDGASYDPATSSWETIAEAPVPLGEGTTAAVDDRIYFLLYGVASSHPDERAAFLAYDVGDDRWHELSFPRDADWALLTTAGSDVLAYQQSQENGVEPDLLYEPATDAWTELPPDPLTPSFDRTFVHTREGLVLFGIEHVPQPGIEPSIYRVAILRDGMWHRLADSEVVGYDPLWWAAGDVVVNASIVEIDGGETNNYGRSYPTGGIFDPGRGAWRDLPEAPREPGAFTGVYAADDRRIVQGQGLVLDVIEESWRRLATPPGGHIDETAAAWTADGLAVWGGVRWTETEGRLLDEGWIWRPAAT